jgi:hypothetical protein
MVRRKTKQYKNKPDTFFCPKKRHKSDHGVFNKLIIFGVQA